MVRRALVPMVTLALAGCGSMRAPGPEVRSPRRADPVPQAPVQPVRASTVSAGNAMFAGRLLALLARNQPTVALSPFSISDTLAVTLAGARAETAAQIASALDFGLPPARLHAAFGALERSLAAVRELSVANALYGQRGLNFGQAFLSLLGRDYQTGMHAVDFAGGPDAARASINSWVSARTHQKIAQLLGPGDTDAMTRLALVDAVYLNAKWAAPFERSATAQGPFYAPRGTLRVPIMHQTATIAYERASGYSAAELPYRGGRLAFDVLLPDAGRLPALLARIQMRGPLAFLNRLRMQRVALAMPKLHLRSHLELADALRALGMTLAFEPGRADLSGIAGAQGDLYVHAVVHEAYLNVDEAGTEAAAATASVIETASAVLRSPPIAFNVDRPFVFVLRDRRTGAILFVGVVSAPS